MTKKRILKQVKRLDWNDQNLDHVATEITALKAEFGGDAVLELYDQSGIGDAIKLSLSAWRTETDSEYDHRVKWEKNTQKAREDNERREFERLTAKYNPESKL